MLVKAFLSGLVVIRSHGENSLHAQPAHLGGEIDQLPGVVAAHARNHGNLLRRFLNHGAHDGQILGVLKRRRFPRGAAGDKEVDAGANWN